MPKKSPFAASIKPSGRLDALLRRKPRKGRRPWGYVVALVIAIVGFGVGFLVSNSIAASLVAAVILFIVGLLANEFWPTTVIHEDTDRYHDL